MFLLKKCGLFFLIGFFYFIGATPFRWQPQFGEMGFYVEIPPEYRRTYSLRQNGVILSFVHESAAIEIRSFVDEKYQNRGFAELVDLKAARLAATYNGVRLLYEKPSFYRENMYLAAWELVHEGIRYIEQTAFFKHGAQILTISCVAPATSVSRYQIAFENAIFSLTPDLNYSKIWNYLRLKSLILYNRPNSQGETKSEEKKSEKPVTPPKKEEAKLPQEEKKESPPPAKTEEIDSFLPPIK